MAERVLLPLSIDEKTFYMTDKRAVRMVIGEAIAISINIIPSPQFGWL